MDTEIIFVFIGIGLFVLAAIFGGLGITFLLKNNRKQAIIFLGIGITIILIYIISFFVFLD
ncbi:hypothetical protein [Evansella cellulosilytica]|uniref:Uncharacterized protein n=1 Tax=Evansella cellulosilytica (strain ATCC 21833 / DSM 2522 / FERM P-1141 / JCM 9156 / N-4) TaxID=649639 RepID=E6TQM0_EVAC2|nr:hypothetical protein [Evansella cellulosilytica]ADU30531.1 hypothetical protein Bcell_2271 [Evansella cellulosilytica DSM 2522]